MSQTMVVEDSPPLVATNRQVVALVRRAAERKLPMFAAFPDVEEADLVQEALVALAAAAHKFDGAAGRWTTFAYTVAARTMIDLYRQRMRQRTRDERGAKPDLATDADSADALDLADWVAEVRRAARERYGGKVIKVGRKFYHVDEAAAVVLLQARLRVSPEGLRWVLGRRQDLLEALGFMHVPSERLFEDAAAILRRAEQRMPAVLAGTE